MRVYLTLAVLLGSVCGAAAHDTERWGMWDQAFDIESNPQGENVCCAIVSS